jgi:hypothetical protein
MYESSRIFEEPVTRQEGGYPRKVGRLGKEDLLSYTVENQNDRQGQEVVVTPWNWTPGKVKARRYTRTKKGVHDDTTTNMYRRI